MHYIIGDVHGHYDTLMTLVARLPEDATLIFVGDLIDRGPKSSEVVKWVREGGHACVMGNHEEMMVQYGTSFMAMYPRNASSSFLSMWYGNGGVETLLSYVLVQKEEGALLCLEDAEALAQFKDDLEWMDALPLYIELPHKMGERPVVVSHANCADVWHHHDNPAGVETFREKALWYRKSPKLDAPIFNIYGHTPVEFGVEVEAHYVNVDTGCYANEYGYGELSAYCVETEEVVSVNRRLEELKVMGK